jgi:aryl-alcohol dehydrogenase-like predicted oxidoreductase
LRRALEGGVSLLRVCAEQGPELRPVREALHDGWRDKVLLAARFGPVDGALLDQRIDEALTALGTDCLDLIELEAGSARAPVFAALLAAQRSGKVRLFGVDAGPSPAALLSALETAQAHGLRFDAVGLPLDLHGGHREDFERRVLPPLLDQEVALLGTIPVESTTVTFAERLRYTLSLPVSAVLLELSTEPQLQHALRAARSFKPYTEKELQALLARAALSTRGGPRGGVFHPSGSVHG